MPLLETWDDVLREVAVGDVRLAMVMHAETVMDGCRCTPQERRGARLLLAGRANGEIAAALCIAEQTVKNHMKNVFRRTGTFDRTQLVLRLVGMIDGG